MDRAYLDHASTSTLRPVAHAAMVGYLDEMRAGNGGDPARVHTEGMRARATLEDARDGVADWLGVRPRQVVFTSGATESIATAHHGTLARASEHGRTSVLLSAVEHSAVADTSRRGPHRVVPVDGGGLVDPDSLAELCTEETALVHLQHTNHELGVIQPLPAVIEALQGTPALLHVDAAQAATKLPEVARCGADLVSISGHKLGAPPGIGVLVLRRNLRIPPLLLGGDQERARRAGMENVAAAVALAAVARELTANGERESARLGGLRDRLIDWVDSTDGVNLLGDRRQRCAHLVCLQLEGIEPQPVLLGLDQRGVAVHSGSSCSSEAFEPSPVLRAIGADAERSLRLSVGWSTSPRDVDRALSALSETIHSLRELGSPR